MRPTPAAARRYRARRALHGAPLTHQRGIALLVAILLVALGTILAAAIGYENAMTARRGAATYAFDQALLVQQGAEALAAYGLRAAQRSDPQHTYAAQGWGNPLGPLEIVPGVMLTAQLEDMQGRFNLNNLVREDGTPDPVQLAAFEQLLLMLGLEPKWAGFMVDWIDRDIVPSQPDGAEDSFYMGQSPPYRTPNRYITSESELLALPGFGRDRYARLAPYVTALPYGTKLNICSASAVVLDAYLGHVDFGSDSTGLSGNRANANGCFPTPSEYQAAFQGNTWGRVNPLLQQTSMYFRLGSVIAIGSAEFNLYSLLLQDPTGAVRPIMRSFTAD
ncbi:MAG TPA: type II secretion system minor pseudopilin GspK [Steroidobacteraceae bacterium]|jgi:general secretion pathway protein K|nr:type II secretion system minor pseudopilin GspK [Steroidobacteraceae bacterium]